MNTTELILLITGALVFTISFLLPTGKKEKKEEGTEVRIPEEEIREKIEGEVREAQQKINDIVEETVKYSMEKTERVMEKTSNEKIMAINEFSNTVLEQIEKNHKEAVFLYDMLNDKHDKLKNTVSEAMTVEGKLKEELEQTKFSPIQAERITVLPDLTAESEARAVALAASGMAGTDGETGNVDVQRAAEGSTATGKAETAGKASTGKTEAEGNARRKKSADGAAKEPARKRKPSPARTKTGEVAQPENQADRKETASIKEAAGTEGKEAAKHVDVSMAAAGKNGSRNNNEKIRELHKAGKSNMAIAKELGLGIGEVKLVLDLFADT